LHISQNQKLLLYLKMTTEKNGTEMELEENLNKEPNPQPQEQAEEKKDKEKQVEEKPKKKIIKRAPMEKTVDDTIKEFDKLIEAQVSLKYILIYYRNRIRISLNHFLKN